MQKKQLITGVAVAAGLAVVALFFIFNGSFDVSDLGAHFAVFPPELTRLCIAASTKHGDTVLDPFGGSGTTGMVATEMGRKAILCELNPDYAEIIKGRVNVTPGLALDTAAP